MRIARVHVCAISHIIVRLLRRRKTNAMSFSTSPEVSTDTTPRTDLVPLTPSAEMVPADKVVADQLVTTSKQHAIAALAKAANTTPAIVKAQHAITQGSIGVLSARTGAGALAHVKAVASIANEGFKEGNGLGLGRLLRAITAELTSVGVLVTYPEGIRADGQRVANGATVATVYDDLAQHVKTGKSGRLTPVAKKVLAARSLIREILAQPPKLRKDHVNVWHLLPCEVTPAPAAPAAPETAAPGAAYNPEAHALQALQGGASETVISH